MTRKLLTLIGLMTFAVAGWCQNYTSVSATITDSNSKPYASCTFNVVLFNTSGAQPLFGGLPLTQTSYPGACNSSGAFTITLPSNAVITTNGVVNTTQWTFNVLAQDGVTGFSSTQTISGSNQSLTSALSSASVAQPCAIVSSPTSPSGFKLVGNCGGAAVGGGSKVIPINWGVGQGTTGCSIAWNYPAATPPTCLLLIGSTTIPEFSAPLFVTPGAIGTGSMLQVGPFVLPSNYTANSNLSINIPIASCGVSTGLIASCVPVTSGTVTYNVRYFDATVPAAGQPTYCTFDWTAGATTISGTGGNTVMLTTVITPNTHSCPTATAGDLFGFEIYLATDASIVKPYFAGTGSITYP